MGVKNYSIPRWKVYFRGRNSHKAQILGECEYGHCDKKLTPEYFEDFLEHKFCDEICFKKSKYYRYARIFEIQSQINKNSPRFNLHSFK